MYLVLRVVFVAVLFHGCSALAAATVLRLGYADIESFPYQMGSGDVIPEQPGVSVEIVRKAAADIGVEVRFLRLPSKRLLAELRVGQIDGAFIFSDNPERRTFARYPMREGRIDAGRRVARLDYYLYRLRGDAVAWNGEWFTGLQGAVGVNTSHAIAGDLKARGVAIEETKSLEQNFAKLKARRIAAVAAQDLTADAYLARAGLVDVEKLPTPIEESDYFLIFGLAFANRNDALVERLWSRIGEIRDEITRQSLSKYIKHQ
jgi:polar amino acid transport system substrate-binding protein